MGMFSSDQSHLGNFGHFFVFSGCVVALGLSCETPVAPPDRLGLATDNPNSPKRAHSSPDDSNTTKILREKKRTNFPAGEKKNREILGPPPFGPPPFGAPPFGPPPFAASSSAASSSAAASSPVGLRWVSGGSPVGLWWVSGTPSQTPSLFIFTERKKEKKTLGFEGGSNQTLLVLREV